MSHLFLRLEIKYGCFDKISRRSSRVISWATRDCRPFVIHKKINLVTYCLKLPVAIKIHLIFHVSLLKPYRESSFPIRVQSLPPSIEIKNHKKYEVDKILDSQQRWGKLEYLVHWSGCDINERTWEAAENLANTLEKV